MFGHRVQIRLVLALAGILPGCQQPHVRPEPSSVALEVTHTPLELKDVSSELRARLAARFGDVYVRFYRTQVTNNTTRVMRIVWFDAMTEVDGYWTASNVRNRVLRTKDFMDWYSTDAITRDGWLLPGGTATCGVNWDWSEGREAQRVKWAYIAVDSQGQDYFAEALVPDIDPVRLGSPAKS
jgi:hypothetical protein